VMSQNGGSDRRLFLEGLNITLLSSAGEMQHSESGMLGLLNIA
jgi:hypothetical protein